MSTENQTLWQSAYKTAPEYTKGYKGAGGFSGTAISSLYPVQRATEIFGAMGHGWGIEILTDEFVQGAPIFDKETKALLCHEQTHSMRIKVWANHNGDKLETIGIGLTPHITWNKKYGEINTDHEVQKKSLTDAIKGALKLWGFSADVYMGMHDDNDYVTYMSSQSAMQKADDKATEAIKRRQEYDDWKVKNLGLIATSVSIHELEILYKSAARKAAINNDEAYTKEIGKAATKRKAELQKADEPKTEEAA